MGSNCISCHNFLSLITFFSLRNLETFNFLGRCEFIDKKTPLNNILVFPKKNSSIKDFYLDKNIDYLQKYYIKIKDKSLFQQIDPCILQ